MAYLIMFLLAFSASTILPISSEATLYYYLYNGYSPLILLTVAGLGNTLGSITNYYIGKKGVDYLLKRQKISQKSLKKSEKFFEKWGGWSLLLSWMPIIGDPITLFAGVMHYPFIKFIILVAIAKFGRYIFIYLLFLI